MKIFQKIRCLLSGHPLPGVAGEFVSTIPFRQPTKDLPHLDSQCPRCGAAMRLYFLQGTKGTGTQQHLIAEIHWRDSAKKLTI